ncbi:unnamed protein product [Linum trigynum]|uniref:Uncharacterized protein n=1 Tax=Linum trigynum TaxID=586398 RepID=A0AAV2FB22_9ROSI
MTHSQSGDLLPLDQELERTCRNFKRALKARLPAEEVLAQLQIANEEEMGDPQDHDVVLLRSRPWDTTRPAGPRT